MENCMAVVAADIDLFVEVVLRIEGRGRVSWRSLKVYCFSFGYFVFDLPGRSDDLACVCSALTTLL